MRAGHYRLRDIEFRETFIQNGKFVPDLSGGHNCIRRVVTQNSALVKQREKEERRGQRAAMHLWAQMKWINHCFCPSNPPSLFANFGLQFSWRSANSCAHKHAHFVILPLCIYKCSFMQCTVAEPWSTTATLQLESWVPSNDFGKNREHASHLLLLRIEA